MFGTQHTSFPLGNQQQGLRCSRNTHRKCCGCTALQLAYAANSGDTKALKIIGWHHEKFHLPPEVYKDNKKLLGAEARKALGHLYSLKDRKDAKSQGIADEEEVFFL